MANLQKLTALGLKVGVWNFFGFFGLGIWSFRFVAAVSDRRILFLRAGKPRNKPGALASDDFGKWAQSK
jgi:hypothetical protein